MPHWNHHILLVGVETGTTNRMSAHVYQRKYVGTCMAVLRKIPNLEITQMSKHRMVKLCMNIKDYTAIKKGLGNAMP